MNTSPSTPHSGAEQLAQGFALHVEQWLRRQGCDAAQIDTLRHAARSVSLATSDGHVCVALADVAASMANATSTYCVAVRARRGSPVEALRPQVSMAAASARRG